MQHEAVLADVVAWATRDANVRAVVLTGSAARDATDDLSDLDIELYVDHPGELLDTSAWYEAFGDVLFVEALPNPEWHPTRLVYFVGGKIDFLVAPAASLADATYVRPFRVLVDKDGRAASLAMSGRSAPRLPDADAFAECVSWFYAAAFMCAKCCARGELWLAMRRDVDLKTQLLRMIEWDHRARYGEAYDTWYLGAHFREWMDADVCDAVARGWARFDAGELAEAIARSTALFRRLCERTAATLGFDPFDHERVGHELHRLLDTRPTDQRGC